MYQLQLDFGFPENESTSDPISDASFGVRYISYHSFDRFIEQIEDLDVGLIVWPGGSLAENREDRYGFEFDDLYNPATSKPGLSDMLALSVEKDADFSMVIPTLRYIDDLDLFRAEVSSFVEGLAKGEFGELPDRIILEVGVEYYANLPGANSAEKAALYAMMAETAVQEIATTLASLPPGSGADRIEIAVQSGKTLADDDIIRTGLSDFALENIDMVIHHHFPYRVEGVDARADRVEDIMAEWRADALEIGAAPPDLYMSAWNVATITRAGVLNDFLDQDQSGLTRSDIDLEGRTTPQFEAFWQKELSKLDYSTDHAGLIVEMFHSYASAGATAGAIYGVDSVHPGRLSVLGDDGENHNFVGLEMFEMLAESVRDCTPIPDTVSEGGDLRVYGFESEDKLVLFLVADDLRPGEITLDLSEEMSGYLSASADSLHGVTAADWMETFGIPDNPYVNESAEGDSYSEAVVAGVETRQVGDELRFSTTQSDQIVRLSFAKTELGLAEIEKWSEGEATYLSDPAVTESVPVADFPTTEVEPFVEHSSGGGSGEFGLIFLLLGFFF